MSDGVCGEWPGRRVIRLRRLFGMHALSPALEGQCRTEPSDGGFALVYVVWVLMNIGSAVFAGMVSLMVLGCAATQPESASEARMSQAQLERQQQTAGAFGSGGGGGSMGGGSMR